MTREIEEAGYWNETYGQMTKGSLLYDKEPFLCGELEFIARLKEGAGAGSVMSAGGGIDLIALELAQCGSKVLCVDLSRRAAEATRSLAGEMGLADRIEFQIGAAESLDLKDRFDMAYTHKSLHHMDVGKAVNKIHQSLKPGGKFFAMEPVCLSKRMRAIHKRLPFHPDYPVTPSERELDEEDLLFVQSRFSKVSFSYHGLITRPSVAYFLGSRWFKKALLPLSRFDFWALNRFLFLRGLSSHVLMEASK